MKDGDDIIIPRGTPLRSMHPQRNGTYYAKSTRRVRVHHLLSGMDRRSDGYAVRKGFELLANASVRWAGAGGYWVEADINDVQLPGHEKTIGQEYQMGEEFVEHDFGACVLLFHQGHIIAAWSRRTGEVIRFPLDEARLVQRQVEFIAGRTERTPDLHRIPCSTAMDQWFF